MKLPHQQLLPYLQKKFAYAYLIAGDEPFFINEAHQQIMHKCLQKGYSQHTAFTQPQGSQWLEIKQHSQLYSLFNEKKVIEIRLKKANVDKTTRAHIIDLIKQNNEDYVLIFKTPKLNKTQEKQDWINTIEKSGLLITITPLNKEQLPRFIKEKLAQHQIAISSEACQLMANYLEGNLSACVQEIEKLSLLFDTNTLSVEDVQQALHQQAQYDVFQLIDSCLNLSVTRSQTILQTLKQEGIEAVLILWAITRDLRILAELCAERENNKNPHLLFGKYGIWEKRKPLFITALKKHSEKSTQHLLLFAKHIDEVIKGMKPGNTWVLFSQLCLQFCQPELI